MSRRYLGAAAALLVFVPSLALAQWIPDGNPVSTAPDQQSYPRVVGDTQGGVIVAWTTNVQGGVDYDLYIERYDAFGQRLWSTDGVTVAATTGNQWKPAMVPDDSGGVYICWEDTRSGNYDIYAQHFDHNGNALWSAGGEAVCTNPADQGGVTVEGPQIVRSDTKSDVNDTVVPGVIICWQDNRNSGSAGVDIYAQRMDETGAVWTADGVVVCGQSAAQSSQQMVTDGANGAIIVWRDDRPGGIGGNDIYAQRINSSGNILWATDGEPVCTAAESQQKPRAVPDGQGGAYVAWVDRRAGFASPYAAYVQRIDGSGAPVWTVDGIHLYGIVEYDEPELAPDPGGGVYVCWRDARLGNVNLFAQRMSAVGVKQWAANGEPVTTLAGDDSRHRLSPDGAGGMYAVWQNYVSVNKVYIQRLDGSGNPAFTAGGRVIAGTSGHQQFPDVCIDDTEPAFVAWADSRAGGPGSNLPDLYLTRVYHSVSDAGGDAPRLSALAVRAFPNPFSDGTELSITTPGPGTVTVDIFDVAGRRVARRTVVAGPGGHASMAFDGRGDTGRLLPGGVYFTRVRAAGLTRTAKIVLMR